MNKNKKIIFILPTLNMGGAEKVAITFIRQISNKNRNIKLIVFNQTEDLLSFVPTCVEIINLKTYSTKKSYFSLLRCIKKIRPDVVVTTHSRVAVLLTFIKPLANKFIHLARLQSMPSLEQKYNVYGPLVKYIYAFGFKCADIVIAQSDSMKIDAEKVFSLNPKKVKVLINPVDKVYIEKSLVNSRSPFSNNYFNIVTSGRLIYDKGFDLAIMAINKVIEKNPNIILYVLGKDGGEEKKLKDLVLSLNLTSHVKFLGYISNPYLYYRYCDIFLLSSRREGLPNVILENLVLNTPIVATSCVPVISKLVKNGKNGVLCKVDDVNSISNGIIAAQKIKRENIKNEKLPEISIIDLINERNVVRE